MSDYTYEQFARALLPKVGCKRVPFVGLLTKRRARALYCHMYAEGHGGAFNPMNSTLQRPGSRAINSVGVQDYVSFAQGVEATAETLNYGARKNVYGYRPIRRRLRFNASAKSVLEAVENSLWGTGGLAREVWEKNGKANIDGYAKKLIPQ